MLHSPAGRVNGREGPVVAVPATMLDHRHHNVNRVQVTPRRPPAHSIKIVHATTSGHQRVKEEGLEEEARGYRPPRRHIFVVRTCSMDKTPLTFSSDSH